MKTILLFTIWLGYGSAFLSFPHRSVSQGQSSLKASPPKKNYFPTRKRGYYEQYLRRLNAKNTTNPDDFYGIEPEEEEDRGDGQGENRTILLSNQNIVFLFNQIQEAFSQEDEDTDFDSEFNKDDYEDDDYYRQHRPRNRGSSEGFNQGSNRGFSQGSKQGFSQGSRQGSKPKKSENFEVVEKSPLTFKDVGGYDNIKQELQQCVDILTHYKKYAKYNVRIPKGLIFEGPPGNGKTMLAKSFAGECNTSFIAVSGSQFQEKYVGVGSTRVRELFDLARKNTPCIVFIDEIDAIGRARSSDGESSSSERDNTLNELLVQLDGFKTTDGVFLIGSTNRADLLDPALIRPNRIDKRIYIGLPDAKTRESILKIHLLGKPFNKGKILMEDLVLSSSGFSGAQLENWLNEAMLNALRQKRKQIEWADLEEVQSKILVGWQPTAHEFSDDIVRRIAVHEMGHAVAGMLCKHHAKVLKVSIQLHSPTSPGVTQFETATSNIYTKEALLEHLIVLLAGRIAEEKVFETSITTGAMDDLERAHELATKMISFYGMGNRVIYPKNSEKYKEEADEEIMLLLNEAYRISEQWILSHLNVIRRGADRLMEKQLLKIEELEELMKETAR